MRKLLGIALLSCLSCCAHHHKDDCSKKKECSEKSSEKKCSETHKADVHKQSYIGVDEIKNYATKSRRKQIQHQNEKIAYQPLT